MSGYSLKLDLPIKVEKYSYNFSSHMCCCNLSSS